MRKCRIFFYKRQCKYHPDLIKTKKDYKLLCAFRFALNSFPKWFDYSLLKKYGMYCPPNKGTFNPNGVSRDHMISISYGWENNIDPKLISHPANCELMLHKNNHKKHKSSSISLDELLQRIKDFEQLYPDYIN